MASIYRHVKRATGEVFYIGITINNKRPYSKSDRNIFWYNLVSKYDYDVEILKTNLSLREAQELEEILINYYGRRDLGKGTLVNLTNGGELNKGCTPSLETRKKQSIAKLGRPRKYETKVKISNSCQGISRSGEHLEKPIVAIDIETNKEFKFKSIKEYSEELGLNRPSISKVLKGNLNKTKNYKFRWQA